MDFIDTKACSASMTNSKSLSSMRGDMERRVMTQKNVAHMVNINCGV